MTLPRQPGLFVALLLLASFIVALHRVIRLRMLIFWTTQMRRALFPDRVPVPALRVHAYVSSITRQWPFRHFRQQCVLRSLLLFATLRLPGEDVRIVFGARRAPAQPLEAHCWLEGKSGVLFDRPDVTETYAHMWVYPVQAA